MTFGLKSSSEQWFTMVSDVVPSKVVQNRPRGSKVANKKIISYFEIAFHIHISLVVSL